MKAIMLAGIIESRICNGMDSFQEQKIGYADKTKLHKLIQTTFSTILTADNAYLYEIGKINHGVCQVRLRTISYLD